MKSLLINVTAGILLLTGTYSSESGMSQSLLAASNETAVSTEAFLDSLGVNIHTDQGYSAASYVAPLRYLGVRNVRDGSRSLASDLMLHRRTGVRVDLVGTDIAGLISAGRVLARADALLSVEGPNEPNNFTITYNGHQGGGAGNWTPVAQLQRDLYSAVKHDPELARYPVFAVSEAGAEVDNVGLQFLTIPAGAGTLFPEGTQYADYANPHNYVSGHGGGYVDNQAWQAADPTLNSRWDGLYVEYGKTWRSHFQGYSTKELQSLPRVTTETGWNAANVEDERVQGVVLVNTYLDQFKRGWSYTFIYELGEGEGGGGNQGLFHKDWTPKLSARFIHNLTSILADNGSIEYTARLAYSIVGEPATVHHLLLQKRDGTFDLIIWGEQVNGSNLVTVKFKHTRSRVSVFDTTIGILPVQKLSNVIQVSLQVGDHAIVLEVS